MRRPVSSCLTVARHAYRSTLWLVTGLFILGAPAEADSSRDAFRIGITDPTGERCLRPSAASDSTDYFGITLVPTERVPGARGYVRVRHATSMFGVAVSENGHYVQQLNVSVEGLRDSPGVTYVVWAAPPNLDAIQKLGTLDEGMPVVALVHFNKFLVFVTAETTADGDRWSGPILLRGVSRSGLIQSMAGHGLFGPDVC